MKDGFKILDSDMHLREPGNLWDKYMEPEWRERAPKILSSTARSSAMVMIEGKILQGYKPAYRGGIFDATRIDEEIKDYRANGFDAKTPASSHGPRRTRCRGALSIHRFGHHDAR